jgi:hypothetical protein
MLMSLHDFFQDLQVFYPVIKEDQRENKQSNPQNPYKDQINPLIAIIVFVLSTRKAPTIFDPIRKM